MERSLEFCLQLGMCFCSFCDMSSDFKLEGVKGHEIEDPEVGSPNGVHKILAERRTMTLSDR